MNFVDKLLIKWINFTKPKNPFEDSKEVVFDSESNTRYAYWMTKRISDYLRVILNLKYTRYPKLYPPEYWKEDSYYSQIDNCFSLSDTKRYTEQEFIDELVYYISRNYTSIDLNGEFEFLPHNRVFQFIYGLLATQFGAKERKFFRDYEIKSMNLLTKEVADDYRDFLNSIFDINIDEYLSFEFNNKLSDDVVLTNWLFTNIDDSKKLFGTIDCEEKLDSSGYYLIIDIKYMSNLLDEIYKRVGERIMVVT